MSQFHPKTEAIFAAAAFAEAGEFETARKIDIGPRRGVRPGWIARFLNAATFAEAGEFETARGFLEEGTGKPARKIVLEAQDSLDEFIARVGLRGARMRFGLARA